MSDQKKQNFKTEMGQKATHTTEELSGPLYAQANRIIKELGQELKPNDVLEHIGSAAIHIYQSPKLGHLFFISQVQPLGNTPEPSASEAMTKLKNEMMKYYGRNPQVRRSGL